MSGRKKAGGQVERTPVSDANKVRRLDSGKGNQQKAQRAKVQQPAEDSDSDNGLDDANIFEDEEGGTRIGDIYIPPPVQPHCSLESSGPRLIIHEIVNKNFKSYAGTVKLGPFHQCFTAIIGPNGSGKSNVIDSMLFVFGYRANKIRCKKISTLLHNSAKYPNMTMCSVAVFFRLIIDRPDGTCEFVPDSDIIVERTAFRDNTSFYSINGRRVQFNEVARLLKKHNIDLDHNRFLILQGEVESIAMMKPKGLTDNETGMLEYLEDLVGTTRYKTPLIKINARVEQLTEERTEKHNRCKLAEREMNDLEQPYNDAVDFLRNENENTRTKNLRIQKYLSEKNKKLEEYTRDHNIVAEEMKTHDEATNALSTELKEKENQVREEMRQFDEMRKHKEETERLMEVTKSKFRDIQTTMTVSNNQRKDDKKQVEKHEQELIDLRKVPAKNAKEIEECEKKIEKLNKQKDDMDNELQKNYALVEEQTKPLIESREKLETELIDLKRDVNEAKSELALSEQELKILKHDETTEMRKYEALKSSYEESQTTLSEKRIAIAEMKKQLPEIVNDIATKTARLKKLQQEEEKILEQLKTLRVEISEKSNAIHTIRSNNKVLNYLMKQKNEGKIPGIFGRLGDLGAIDSEYDVAISTCCGRLDSIVVDTVSTAEECIEHLKRFDIGRASFIALEKVSHLASQLGPIKTPENVPRLYDLIRVEDKRMLPVFYFALRNTLVSVDLDQGTRIAYGECRYRVVSLQGEVVEISGTMSGGGDTQIRGKIGTEVQMRTTESPDASMASQKAVEEMQILAEDLQCKVNANQEEQGQLEQALPQLKNHRQRTETDIQKLAITISSFEQQLPRILKQFETQKTRMQQSIEKADTKKVSEIEARIAEIKIKFAKCEEAADVVSDKIKIIRDKIEAIHGDKVKSVQTKIKQLGTQSNKLTANVLKLRVEVTTSERNVAKVEAKIESLQAEILKAQEKITQLSVERKKLDDETVRLAAVLEEAQKAIDDAKSQSSGIHTEITKLQKKISDQNLKRVEIEEKLRTLGAKITDVKAQIPHWREQLRPLKLNEIPGETEPQAPLKTYTEEELAAHSLQDIQYKESVQEEQLKKKPNLLCIGEYIGKRDVYLERVKVLEDITSKRNEMRQLYDDVRKKRYNEFMQGFHIITRKLKEMYQMITQGGDAELELVDSMDPFTEGVSFSVRPPKKTWKNIANLSGGEKTLSSLALVFALHYYKPSPLYFLDEIDAALDFKNISIVAHYIKECTKNAQFIIISLRSNMFELCDRIVGIYKVKDCTDAVTIINHVYEFQPPPAPHSQAPVPLTQDASVGILQDTSLSPRPSTIDNRNNQSGRNTTFAPPAESTALSQSQLPTTDNTEISVENVGDDATVANSINDTLFKKPLPPSGVTTNQNSAITLNQ